MIRKIQFSALLFLTFVLMSFSMHKFYVSIHKIEYAQEKKMLQITSRIFVDDLNAALELRYRRKAMFGEPSESAADVADLKKYFSEKFRIKTDSKVRALEFVSHEYEGNVAIFYFRVRDVSKFKSIEITNSMLTEYVTDQQNIIQTTIYGGKSSLLLTAETPSGTLKF